MKKIRLMTICLAATVVGAGTRLQFAWDLGRYICAYPELEFTGAKGARIAWCWTESARDGKTKRKASVLSVRNLAKALGCDIEDLMESNLSFSAIG